MKTAKNRDALGRPQYRRIPDGINGVRDVDSRCELFAIGEPSGGGDCMGDGHYLCVECVHWKFSECEFCGEKLNLDYLDSHVMRCERKHIQGALT